MKRSVGAKRLDYEVSAGWTTYGTSPAAFSLFLGVATRHAELLKKISRAKWTQLLFLRVLTIKIVCERRKLA